MGKEIHIRDLQTLYDLHNALEFCAEQLTSIVEGVNNYLDGVLRVMETQKELLQKRLEEAKEKVRKAEEALYSCETSQKWDEEKKEYVPDCSSEASVLRAARDEEDECAAAYREAERIYGECEREISKYHDKGGFITPPGGEWTIRNLADEKTEQAVKRLDEIIEQLRAILLTSMGGGVSSSGNSRQRVLENGPLSEKEKAERFGNAVKKLNQEIKDGNGNIPGSNRVMVCPECKRPLIACTCENQVRERIMIYNNIRNSR